LEWLQTKREQIINSDVALVLIYINEAHSKKWKKGLKNHPDVHRVIGDRIRSAKHAVRKLEIPFPVFVDNWDSEFEENYHSWPDKHYLIDNHSFVILDYTRYDHGIAINDYATLWT
jgi:hypothetical protein